MGWLQDLLKEIPLSSVLKERVALAEDKYQRLSEENDSLKHRVADIERQNAELRAQIPAQPDGALGADTTRILVDLFKAEARHDHDVGALANHLGMERGVAQYHLDQLKNSGLAAMTGGNYLHGHTYWGLTSEGRRHVVENGLV